MHNNNEIFLNHTNSSFYDIFKNNFMANFMLSIQKVKYKIKDNTKNIIFMNQLKTLLYN
jgi:3-isopropylmalate dehydratase small subunit